VAIFAETDVQSAFAGILPFLSSNDAKQLRGRLAARAPNDRFAAEWEVILMDAIRHCGRIEIQNSLRSATAESSPDVLLRSSKFDQSDALAPCYIEISAISDGGYEADNPQRYFLDAFRRLVTRLRLPMHHFYLDIGGVMRDKTQEKRTADVGSKLPTSKSVDWAQWFRGNRFNDRKMQLGLPPRSQIDRFLNTVVANELEPVLRKPGRPRHIPIRRNGISVDINYNPRRSSFSCGYPSYTTAYSLEYNPVANRLKKKRKQVSQASATRGIILCDSGCDLLADRGYPGPDGFRLRDIISDVLSRRPEISFVVTYSVNQKINGWGHYEGLQLAVSAFYNPQKATFPIQNSLLDAFVRKISDQMPVPEQTPTNARHAITRSRLLSANTLDTPKKGIITC
jgi:hypothetical protein